MNTKTKQFLENNTIVIIVVVIIYGIYSLIFTEEVTTVQQVQTPIKETVVVKKVIPKEIVKPKVLEVVKIETNKIVHEIPKIEVQEPKTVEIIRQEIPKQVVEIKSVDTDTIIEKAKKKFINKELLNIFLTTTKMSINNKIVGNETIDNLGQIIYLKIRVTILKDGSYEHLKYIGGNKELFDINKENIVQVFPVQIDEKIQDQFPRYFRTDIKYESIKDSQ